MNTVFGLSLLVASAHAFCSFPCTLQQKTLYNDALKTDLTPVNAYTYVFNGLQVNCFQRSGPFILTRRGANNNLYRCYKLNEISENAFSLIETPLIKYDHPPEFCDICSTRHLNSTPEIWIVKEKLFLGCNLPKNCPIVKSTDNSCDGCEPDQPDDGMCCKKPEDSKYSIRSNEPENYNRPPYNPAPKSTYKHEQSYKQYDESSSEPSYASFNKPAYRPSNDPYYKASSGNYRDPDNY